MVSGPASCPVAASRSRSARTACTTARSQKRCQPLTPDTEIGRYLSQRPTGCVSVLRRGQQLLTDSSLLADVGALLG